MYNYTSIPLLPDLSGEMGERYYLQVWVGTDPNSVEHFQPQTHAKEFELSLIRTSNQDGKETVKIITHGGSPNGWYETLHYLPAENDLPRAEKRQALPAGWDFETAREYLQSNWEDFAFAYRHYREREQLPPVN